MSDDTHQEAVNVRGTLPWELTAKGTPFHLPNRHWSLCNDLISMDGDTPVSMVPTIKNLLENDYRVMMYNGETDLNWLVVFMMMMMMMVVGGYWHA